MGMVTAAEAQAALPSWRVLLNKVHAVFATGDFATGARFIAGITSLAEAADHHPDIDLRYRHVHIRMNSHDVGGLTDRDIDLAQQISRLADDMGIDVRPHCPMVAEIAIDAVDIPAVMPFWQAVLGYSSDSNSGDPGDTDVVDPAGTGPTVWFQQMDEPRPQRNRVHIDVHVPHDLADERVSAAIEAGGRLVSDAHAPSFWVLADAEGNEACVCRFV